jgi:hypothetical protein
MTAVLGLSRNLTLGERGRGSPRRCGSLASVKTRLTPPACRTRHTEMVASLSPKTCQSMARTTTILRGGCEKPDTEFSAYSCGNLVIRPRSFSTRRGVGGERNDVLG